MERVGSEVEGLMEGGVLDAVDRSTAQVGEEDACTLRFRLNGKVYTAVEDPCDGYRSCLEALSVSEETISNVFPPCQVVARFSDPEGPRNLKHNVLQLVDTITGKTVLQVGTSMEDDYYPMFIATWYPQNMAINQPPTPPEWDIF